MNDIKASRYVTSLPEWLYRLLQRVGKERQQVTRQMHLLETLPLGGRKQLMLIGCAGERFLVGGSLERVEIIVRVEGEISHGAIVKETPQKCL